MTVEDVEAALAAHRHAKETTKETLTALHSAIAAAIREGIPQVEVTRVTGYSRERIRQITRASA